MRVDKMAGKAKQWAACVLAAVIVSGSASVAAAPQELVQELQEELDLSFFDRYWSELDQEVREYLPGLYWRDLIERLPEGETVLEPGRIMTGLGRFVMGEFGLHLKLMGQLLLLAVAAAFLKNLESAFEREQVATLTRSIVFIVLIGICLRSFSTALATVNSSVNSMTDFTLAMLPTLLALLAAQGSLASQAMLHPMVIFGISFFGTAIRNVIVPLILLATVLGLANHFSPHFKVGKLADFFRDLSIWGTGLAMTIFVSILVVQGTAGTVADAVSMRTVKYMTGTFVPVVGKMLSDAVETVAGASIVLKNGIYLAGVVLLLLFTLFPLLKVAAMAVIYKLSGALIQPLGESSLGEAVNTMGNSLVLLVGALAAASVIFFLAVTVVVGAGNIAIMFR
jgi:stage III sporulation protein AE